MSGGHSRTRGPVWVPYVGPTTVSVEEESPTMGPPQAWGGCPSRHPKRPPLTVANGIAETNMADFSWSKDMSDDQFEDCYVRLQPGTENQDRTNVLVSWPNLSLVVVRTIQWGLNSNSERIATILTRFNRQRRCGGSLMIEKSWMNDGVALLNRIGDGWKFQVKEWANNSSEIKEETSFCLQETLLTGASVRITITVILSLHDILSTTLLFCCNALYDLIAWQNRYARA